MHGTLREPLRKLHGTDDGTSVVEHLDQVIGFNAACFGISGIDTYDPVVVSIDKHTMILDIVDDAVLAVAHCMKTEPGVWRNQL